MTNPQIYITSINKAVNRSKVYGYLDLKIPALFNLFMHFIEFTDELETLGYDGYQDLNIWLKQEISKLKYKYPNIICNYKTVINNGNNANIPPNTAPTISDNSVDLEENDKYIFEVGDFLQDYNDAENHSWKYLMIYPTADTVDGVLVYGPDEITAPIVINIQNMDVDDTFTLEYKRYNNDAFGPIPFNFRVSDDPFNYLFSAIQVMSVNADVYSGANQPPSDIGDNTVYRPNRAITIITLDMLTTDLTPPYNDPESDLLDAIRIIDISNANQGVYYVDGNPITEGQIITREQMEAELFTHEGPDQDAVSSDVFKFEARDEGSQTWVQ